MKKITPLIIAMLLSIQFVVSQEMSNSNSMVVASNHSLSCNTQGVTRANTYYRIFNPKNYGVHSAYHINEFQFGIEKLAGAPAEGYPVTVKIYSVKKKKNNRDDKKDDDDDDEFPEDDDLKLRGEVTEMLTNQELTVYTANINAVIPANQKFVVAISVPSDVRADGGRGRVRFDIGSNNAGESTPSYIMANECSIEDPQTYESQGRDDIHLVMNVVGTSATAGIDDLALVDFSYYPNPVKDKLIMKAKENITSVSLYNMLGQEIKKSTPSQLNTELDLTFLNPGTYFVKAIVNGKTGSFKLVKS